jgi:putative endonuclease
MRERDGTLVFVEVRARRRASHGGAAASIGVAKQRALRWAAQHYLLRWHSPPPCRFDVVALDGDALEWLRGAFEGG